MRSNHRCEGRGGQAGRDVPSSTLKCAVTFHGGWWSVRGGVKAVLAHSSLHLDRRTGCSKMPTIAAVTRKGSLRAEYFSAESGARSGADTENGYPRPLRSGRVGRRRRADHAGLVQHDGLARPRAARLTGRRLRLRRARHRAIQRSCPTYSREREPGPRSHGIPDRLFFRHYFPPEIWRIQR